DGRVDYQAAGTSGDPGCAGPDDTSERCSPGVGCAQCDDGLNNDGFSGIDFLLDGNGDPQCGGPTDNDESGNDRTCSDGIDNDGDGLIDGNDPGCTNNSDPTEQGTAACDDGIDNDGDGRVDYRAAAGAGDPGCTSPSDTSERQSGGA